MDTFCPGHIYFYNHLHYVIMTALHKTVLQHGSKNISCFKALTPFHLIYHTPFPASENTFQEKTNRKAVCAKQCEERKWCRTARNYFRVTSNIGINRTLIICVLHALLLLLLMWSRKQFSKTTKNEWEHTPVTEQSKHWNFY